MHANDQYDPDQQARDYAAIAAQERAQRVAGGLAAEHADTTRIQRCAEQREPLRRQQWRQCRH